MEELGQGMTLLEKMREVIGPSFDAEYKARVRTLYAALPDFTTTFDTTAVNVIDVDAENEDMMPTTTKKRPFVLQEVEIKQELNSPLLAEDDQAYFESGAQWLLNMRPKPVIRLAPDSDKEHVLVNDDDGNLVGNVVQSKRARRLAAEAAEKLKKK